MLNVMKDPDAIIIDAYKAAKRRLSDYRDLEYMVIDDFKAAIMASKLEYVRLAKNYKSIQQDEKDRFEGYMKEVFFIPFKNSFLRNKQFYENPMYLRFRDYEPGKL